MKSSTLVLLAVVACIGAAVADFGYDGYGSYGSGYGSGYGSYGGGYASMGSYMPMPVPGPGVDSSLIWLIGFLFIFMLLINNGLFNNTASNGTTVSFVSG